MARPHSLLLVQEEVFATQFAVKFDVLFYVILAYNNNSKLWRCENAKY